MTSIGRSDALGPLTQTLRLAGAGRVPGEVDTARPITVTYDASRAAERLSYLVVPWTHLLATAGGGLAVYATIDLADLRADAGVAAQLANLGLSDPGSLDLWVLDVTGFTNTPSNLLYATCSCQDPRSSPGIESDLATHFLGFGNDTHPGTATTAIGANMMTYDPNASGVAQFPFSHLRACILPRRTGQVQMKAIDVGAGVLNASFAWTFAITPRGIVPSL